MDIVDILGRIGFDWRVFLFNLINFAIIAVLLQKFFFGKVVKIIEERKRLVEEGIKNAEKAEEALRNAENERKELIAKAKAEANDVIESAVVKARENADTIIASANDEVDKIKDKAKQSIAKEKEQMISDVKESASDLVVLATEKILTAKSSHSSQDRKDIEKIIQNIDMNK